MVIPGRLGARAAGVYVRDEALPQPPGHWVCLTGPLGDGRPSCGHTEPRSEEQAQGGGLAAPGRGWPVFPTPQRVM